MGAKMKVAVCIASRGRPELCRKTAETLLAGATLPDTVIAVALDADDPELANYALPARCIVSIADREDSLGAKWNRAYRAGDGDLSLIWADDTIMPDRGWDAALATAAATLPDQCGAVLFGQIDGVLQPGIAITRKFADAMGFFAVPYFPFWWCDTWCIEISTMAGRAVHADVRASLLNDLKGASRGIREIRYWATFFDALRPSRVEIAEQIIRDGPETPERKALLLGQIGDWAERWTRSNAVLRDQQRAADLEHHYSFDAPENDRYRRLKAAADAMLKDLP